MGVNGCATSNYPGSICHRIGREESSMSKSKSNGYSVKVVGPGLSFERPISEQVANRVVNIVMTGAEGPVSAPGGPASVIPVGAASTKTNITAKQFMAERRPSSNYERVACLAYYLTHYGDTPQFKTVDITKVNTEAAQPSLSNASLFMKHATNTYHFLSSAGGGKRHITTLSEAIVTAVPHRETANR